MNVISNSIENKIKGYSLKKQNTVNGLELPLVTLKCLSCSRLLNVKSTRDWILLATYKMAFKYHVCMGHFQMGAKEQKCTGVFQSTVTPQLSKP